MLALGLARPQHLDVLVVGSIVFVELEILSNLLQFPDVTRAIEAHQVVHLGYLLDWLLDGGLRGCWSGGGFRYFGCPWRR